MTSWQGRIASERTCLRMIGADGRSVLQAVVTNDVDRVAPGRAVYAAILTPQGKYLFDFFLIDDGGEGMVIDVAAERADALAKRLKMYCLRRDARVEAAEGLHVAQIWPAEPGARPGCESGGENGGENGGGGAHPPTPPPPPFSPPGSAAAAMPDPRDEALGWRLYGPDPEALLTVAGAAQAGRAAWDALRVRLGIPETGVELVPEESFVLEAGFERLAGVDFRKGCYVGQEITARMKHKTELRKRVVRVAVEGAAPPGTPIVTAEGKPAGTLFTQAGGEALAHLRLDRATGPLTAGDAMVTGVLAD